MSGENRVIEIILLMLNRCYVTHEQHEKYLMKTPFTYCSRIIALVVLFALVLVGCGSQTTNNGNGPITVNLGYFPNLTHAVALVGVERGTFQNALGPNVK